MKFTYNWLKDFVDVRIPAQQLADKLTMAGLEVTGLQEKDGDFIFEAEVTSNRPDWLSVIGIAREVAAVTGKKFNVKSLMRKDGSIKHKTLNIKQLSIEVENRKDCPFYSARIIKGVKVGPSPEWLKARLELIGCRSVNNAVDITNYMLFTYGQPLHAFDLDKLNSQAIIVRRARTGEKIATIDGQERLLSPDILVIADTRSPLALAGIIGGKDTQVSQDTKNILLEAACFDPLVVRRARQKLGVQSDSAYRFERGVDISTITVASDKAAELMEEICGGKISPYRSKGSPATGKRKINFGTADVSRVLGVDIIPGKAKGILNNLGFKVKSKAKNLLSVDIPASRPDIKLGIDLIEEIARIFGYENIPQSLPRFTPKIAGYDMHRFISLLKEKLTGLGLNEAIIYSLTDCKILQDFGVGQSAVIGIANPLSQEQEVLRPTLVPGMIKCVSLNLNRKQHCVNIFEAAKVFYNTENRLIEEWVLGIAICGSRSLLLEQGLIRDPQGFLHLKGILEDVFAALGIKDYSFVPANQGQIDVICRKEKIGSMLKIKRDFLESAGIKNKDVFAAEISLEKIFSCVEFKKSFAPLPVYPGISRDISILIKDSISAREVLRAVRENITELLEDVAVTDYYKGKQIPAGFKGLTISCFYRSDKRTLTEPEINPLHFRISKLLTEKFSAQIR